LRHEDARVARYGRPASVLIVDVTMTPPGGEDRWAGRLGAAIRAQARDTDRVARVGPATFHVLLPETDDREASALADRICRACRDVLPMPPGPVADVRTSAASPTGGGTLADALRLAQARLAD
jgi:GGDEF domain-containing protein